MKRFFNRATRLARPAGRRANGTLVVADHDNATLNIVTRVAVAAASELGNEVTVLVAGKGCGGVAEEASKVTGVAKVAVADDPLYENCLAENVSSLIKKMQDERGYTHIMMANNSFAKNILPRAAALLDLSQVSDVMAFKSPDTFTRAMYAGNALCTVQSEEAVKLLTVRTTAWPPAEDGKSAATVENVAAGDKCEGTSFVAGGKSTNAGPSLTSSKKVVSGGRGMQNGDNFQMLYEMAGKLDDCAVGASRAAVDAGFIGNELQVGQTGKVVAPDLYVAVGISGAIQHLAGMKDSKVIVAVNKDPEAPIFQIADYGLEADLFKAVPELNEKLAS